VEENRLLLVEDEAPLRRSLENFLHRGGYAFDSCGTSREALAQALECHYDVAIVEYHLSDGDGIALIERLRTLQPNLRAIMISAYDFQAIADELQRMDVYAFLKKPFDPIDLETALRSACSKLRLPCGTLKMYSLVTVH
jgi:DNA-binding NtrC family response regulator